jgi:PAS domain S-box-containing protein
MGISSLIWKHKLSIAVGSLGFVVNGAYMAYEYMVGGKIPLLSPTLEHIIIFLGMPLGMLIGYLVEKNMRLQESLRRYVGDLELEVEERGKELRDVTRHLVSVIENAGDAIILADSGGNILSWNKGAEKLLGYTSEEMVGEHLSLIVPEDRMEEFKGIFQKVMKGERVVDLETRRRTKDGRLLDVLVTVSPIIDDGGAIIGTSGIITDITELKSLQRDLEKKVEDRTRDLRESEERYRLLVENANDGIYIRTLDGKLTFVNRRYAEVYGYEPEEMMGRDLRELRSQEDHEKIEAIYKKALKEQRPPDIIETKCMRKDGTLAYLQIRPSFIVKEGEIVGIQGIVRDITHLREMEEELKGYAQELERASRLKDLYIDIIHHDLINPLGVIRNLAELVLEEEDPEMAAEYHRIMHKKVEDAVEMVENASRLWKIEESGTLKLSMMDLKDVMKEVVRDLDTLAREKNMTVDLKVQGDTVAQVNPLIYDVFSNLLSNAIKYGPEGSSIQVDMEDGGDHLKVMVKDRGEGVPDEYKEKIFKRFERRMKEGVKGTGLGLAIVLRVVELHGGRAWVEDNPGGGSIFCVTIPKEGAGGG